MKATFICSACSAVTPRWTGKCATCDAWNTIEQASSAAAIERPPRRPVQLSALTATAAAPMSSGIGEFDRVLGGGLLSDSVTLIGGEPGAGKSTLALQVATATAGLGARVLVVSGEESEQQVAQRAARLEIPGGTTELLITDDLDDVDLACRQHHFDLVVIDSIQTVVDRANGAPKGTTAQVQSATERIVELAKGGATAFILVGHVTKDGVLAGPRSLEHLVDTVMALEGDRHQSLRILRSVKHRFGSTGEIGLFEMTPSGLAGVDDPARLVALRPTPVLSGTAMTVLVHGSRPLLAEIQSLVVGGASGRRTAHGIDSSRLALMLAVIEQRAGIPIGTSEVFASIVGGFRALETAPDLALALSLASAVAGRPLADDTIVFGEVGLCGEVRPVAQAERRISEAQRLGFTRAVVPWGVDTMAGIEVIGVNSVAEAIDVALPLPMPR